MKKKQVSFLMNIEDHKNLKVFCVETGISMKEFLIENALEKIYKNKKALENSGK